MSSTNTRKKPLLLHVVPVPLTLSAFFAGQIEYMKKKGFEVAAISSPGPQTKLVERRDNINIYQVPMLRRISPLADIIALFKLFKIMRKLQPTIVHSHITKAGLLGMIAAYLARVPVRIFTLHGIRSEGLEGVKKKILDVSEKLTCRLAQRIFSVSDSTRQEALNLGYCGEDKIKVLANGTYNGVDAKGRFNPEKYPKETGTQIRRKYGIPEKALVLGCVSRIVRDKGIAELVEAWQKLRVEFENLYLLMVSVFESGDPVSPEVAQILNNDDRIVITGYVYDMPEHYLAADLLTLPTHREGFGYAIIEGAAMGLPAVATRVTGCVDALEDGRTGILVPAKDAGALYEAIKRLLLDKPLREELGRAGRQRVLKCFVPETIWAGLHNEYVDLMRKHTVG